MLPVFLTVAKLAAFSIFMGGAACWAVIFHIVAGRF